MSTCEKCKGPAVKVEQFVCQCKDWQQHKNIHWRAIPMCTSYPNCGNALKPNFLHMNCFQCGKTACELTTFVAGRGIDKQQKKEFICAKYPNCNSNKVQVMPNYNIDYKSVTRDSTYDYFS
jgi:hypothetical protein